MTQSARSAPRIRALVRRTLPERMVLKLRAAKGRATPLVPPKNGQSIQRSEGAYETLYEAHARTLPPESSIGAGDYDLILRIELSVLVQHGLKPSSTLLDFGCGTGRLAVHAIPYLEHGRYIGTDVSQTMIAQARERLQETVRASNCAVELRHQPPDAPFPVADGEVDILCAFSVFTHMEHEDTHNYLAAARRAVRADGSVVASCLPMHLNVAQHIFCESASQPLHERWGNVRNVTTSVDLMSAVAELAGWRTVRWHDGQTPSIDPIDGGDPCSLGQSVVVLEPA